MAHYSLRNATDQNMLETSQSMSRCNDQIDIVIFCKSADIRGWRAIRKRRLKFYAFEVYRAHELSHVALGSFASSLLQGGNVVDGSAFARIDVSEIRSVQQNDPGPKFIGETQLRTGDLPASNRKNLPARESC